MKVNKRFVLAGVSLASALLLTACGGGSSNQSTYSYIYSTDPNTLDYIASTRTTTSDITSNLVDGLLENDKYGNLIPSLEKTGLFRKMAWSIPINFEKMPNGTPVKGKSMVL